MPGEGYIRRLGQGSREVELRSAVDLYLGSGFAGLSGCFVVQLHALRQFKGNGLQLVSVKGDHFGSLAAAVHIGLQVVIGKCHVHIRNIRHALAIFIQLHGQFLTGIVGSGKCIRAAVGISSRDMGDDKALAFREIRMLLSKEAFITGRLCAIIADLCQGFPVFQLGNLKGTVSGSTAGRLYAISRSTDITELDSILVRAVAAQAIIGIVIIRSAGDIDGLGGRGSCLQHSLLRDLETDSLSKPQAGKVDFFFLCRPFNDTRNGPSGFFIVSILGFRFLQHLVHFLRGNDNHCRILSPGRFFSLF